ncbi:MAG: hypothetical protein ACPL3C_05545, partial [Pyrobaculum sp.]
TQLGYLNLPGPGFTIATGNSNWNIFKMNCVYTNSFFHKLPRYMFYLYCQGRHHALLGLTDIL